MKKKTTTSSSKPLKKYASGGTKQPKPKKPYNHPYVTPTEEGVIFGLPARLRSNIVGRRTIMKTQPKLKMGGSCDTPKSLRKGKNPKSKKK